MQGYTRKFFQKTSIPNALSFLRLILAPFVLFVPPNLVLPLICIAALTDVLDGYLARAWHATTRFGTALDPLADKVFALFCAYLFFVQGDLSLYKLICLFSRDISLCLFTIYLYLSGQWKSWAIRSFFCGKVSTSLQFIVFACLALAIPVPGILYLSLLFFGTLSPFELIFLRSRS
jgi:phosphatidylglycerophosphate synthase